MSIISRSREKEADESSSSLKPLSVVGLDKMDEKGIEEEEDEEDEEAREWEGEEGMMGIEERLPSSAHWWFCRSVWLRLDSVRLCKDVVSSNHGRSWKAGGKGGSRGAPLLFGNQGSSSPESEKPNKLVADKRPDSSMGKRGKC